MQVTDKQESNLNLSSIFECRKYIHAETYFSSITMQPRSGNQIHSRLLKTRFFEGHYSYWSKIVTFNQFKHQSNQMRDRSEPQQTSYTRNHTNGGKSTKPWPPLVEASLEDSSSDATESLFLLLPLLFLPL